jgi:hypothetical protein
LDPYPGGSHWCTYPFLPRGHRPSPHREWLGTQQYTRTATSVRSGFSGLQSFANVQASRFARHPGCSYRLKVYTYQGSRGFYFHAYLGLLPPRAVDMLAVRNRVTDGVGTFTPQDSRPCWPLPRRCHAISAIGRFVPGSSQNRTWSVTPSGSRFESSTKGWDHPINSGRLPSVLSLEAFAQPFGLVQQSHQGVEPHPRFNARLLCETLKSCGHGLQSSQCRAVCPSRVISNRHPFAPPALPGIHATIGGSDFRTSPPMSSLFTLVHGCPLPADRCADLLGYRILALSGSTRPRTPGSTRATRRRAARVVACRRDKPVGTLRLNFSGLYTFKVGITRYPCTSPAFVPTHLPACYQARSKARYWARG